MSGFDSSRGRGRFRLHLAVAVLLLVTASVGGASAAVLILPLGDSITHGGAGDGGVPYPTYRAWLYQDLRGLGYDVDFVGSLDKPEPPAGSDPDNEGHAAYTSGEVLAELPAWLEAYPPPEVALVHLGTNDALQGIPVAQTAADLRGIIGVLRARNPSMTILVAQIIPTSVASTNARIEALNAEIAGFAALSTGQSRVIVVDMHTGFDPNDDLQSGGVHPGTSGEKKMAAQWLGALLPVLAAGVPVAVPPAPTPGSAVVTTVPASSPAVTTTAPAAAPTVTTAVSRFGARTYRIGSNAGQSRTATSGSTLTGSSTSRTTVSSASSALTPPTTLFKRWYPAVRWSAGLR